MPRTLDSLLCAGVLMAQGLSSVAPAPALGAQGSVPSPPPASTNVLEAEQTVPGEALQDRISLGERYARGACQQCHLFPEPDLLDKQSWQNFVLPKMMLYLGLSSLDDVKVPDRELVRASGIVPTVPRIPRSYWGPIVTYYLHTAPEKALPQAPKGPVTPALRHFEVVPPRSRHVPPLTTLVQIDSSEHVIYAADAQTQTLDILTSDGAVRQSIEVGNIPVSLKKTERGLYLSCIGHFFPSERKQGQIILLEKTADGFRRKVILSDLPRVSDIEFADLNGDGKPDFVLAMFGYLTGRMSWFENRSNDQYEEHILFPKAGPMQVAVRDFTGDGAPDVAVLIGQEHDGLYLYENDRGHPGQFTGHDVMRQPPAFGPDAFETADFNGDGRLDFLVANGDAADYPQPPKRYHGLRIYLNRGRGRFEMAFFFPLNGASRAVARDFDLDGDLDIAAVAFFPDYQSRPMESFIYLENQGNLTFTASTFPQSSAGRWLTLDAGDLDGDGDDDIVLGSLSQMPGHPVPPQLQAFWEQRGPSVLILRNTTR